MSAVMETERSPRTLRDLLDPQLMSRLDRLDVLSRKIFLGKLKGERRSKRRGQSVEFADYRNYAVGDDLRFIDWNIYGRLDRLFLRLFLEEEDLCLHLIVDSSASMAEGDPSKAWAAKRIAAALGYIGLVNSNRVTLTAFADGVVAQKANLRGRHQLANMAELLLAVEPEGDTQFRRAARQIALSRRGKGVAVVLSDFLMKEGYEQGLRYLIGRQYDMYVLQILSPQELDPPLAGDLRLVDVEDDDVAEVTISAALLKRYKAALESYCGGLNQFCTRRGVAHVRTSSATAVETLVLDYLRKRGLLG
jgi:uncharacterized protein (DUF58 family)